MHIPDGFLNATTCAGAYALAGAGLAVASRRVTAAWNDRTVPLIGVMSAFVFAGQMVNFPVASGTSGHLLGGVLAAVFLGPWAAAMVLATVLVVQCLFFQDGGLTSLGANLLNLALIGIGSGWLVLRGLRRLLPGENGRALAIGVASWVSVVAASVACAFELALSGTAPARLVVPAMGVTHAVIGLGEAVITVAVATFVMRVRPDLAGEGRGPTAPLPARTLWTAGSLAALGVALLLSPFASSLPDGLERVADRLAFLDRGTAAAPAPFADYNLPGVQSPVISTALAALIGTLVCLGVAWAVARWLASRSKARRA